MSVHKYSLTINRHRTSVSLEEAFFEALNDIARERGEDLSAVVARIDAAPRDGGLSSAIRVFVLDHYRRKAAGHGPD